VLKYVHGIFDWFVFKLTYVNIWLTYFTLTLHKQMQQVQI